MSRNSKILWLCVAVAAILGIIISQKSWSTITNKQSEFAIKDTASITKVFLADKRGHSVTLAKNEQGIWLVDNIYEADITKIELLLATMKQIAVRNPVPETAYNSVIASMATDGVKVEFYEKDDLIKTIYVGSSTPDQTGTFMLIEGAKMPFITHIQGFVGYLTPRFYPMPIKWKSKKIVSLPSSKIASVKVQYPQQVDQSFELINDKNVILKSINGIVPIADQKFVQYYLSSFENLYFEGYEEYMTQPKMDSIKNTIPYCIVDITDKNGVKVKLQLNYKNVGNHTKVLFDDSGQLLPNDAEKFFGFINDEKDMVYVQQFSFGKVLKTLSDFKVTALP